MNNKSINGFNDAANISSNLVDILAPRIYEHYINQHSKYQSSINISTNLVIIALYMEMPQDLTRIGHQQTQYCLQSYSVLSFNCGYHAVWLISSHFSTL